MSATRRDRGSALTGSYARNRGFISEAEQGRLGESAVAIAGAGGDGGRLAVTLARLGVGSLRLADPECFEVENLNRQEGCTMATIGRNKAEVIGELVAAINPAADLATSATGISDANVDEFVEGADVVVDEIDYTCHWLSVTLHRAARARGIPVATGLNVGFGCLVTSFVGTETVLEDLLGLDREATLDQIEREPVALERWVPRLPGYIADDVVAAVGAGLMPAPSVAPGVDLTSACLSTEVFNHLTGRTRPIAAPEMLWVDALERGAEIIRAPRAAVTH